MEGRLRGTIPNSRNHKNRVAEEKVVPRKGLESPLSFEKRILSPIKDRTHVFTFVSSETFVNILTFPRFCDVS